MTELKCIIVDDERLARLELQASLLEIGGCQIIGQANNARAARPLIESLRPDLLFLDINMPGVDGFELLAKLQYCPLVVFVTAYDQYAIKAFEVHALDYLMKPVSPLRLSATLQQVRSRLEASPSPTNRLFIKSKEGGKFLDLDRVYLVRADDHYLRVYHPGGMDLIHESLTSFSQRTPPRQFFRANRSELVRVAAIHSIEHLSRGRYRFGLPHEQTVVVAEKRAISWRKTFGKP